MKNRILTILLLLVTLFTASTVKAQAPKATPQEAITGLLNRIGGEGAADKFKIVIDASLAQDGKDVFVITAQDGKPCIKGNSQLSVATGINWYLNHHAHINLTWNNLTTDLSAVTLPVPTTEEKHVCNTTYRYDFNTCTFSYSMAFWTWERWQQEIDWMALHGINAPLNLVGLDVVTRKFLRELGVSENDINAYIAGPGFIAWFAMNNLEGWGGTINANDVTMNGNPDWWYTRQEQLCRNMLQRMRELGMQPVIPGFSGQVPNCIVNYTIDGFNSGDVVNNGTWAGGYTRPDILKPNTESYRTFATVYYKQLHEVMGVSEFYSIDPFHEGSLPSGVSNETCYPNIMVELDNYYNGVSQEEKAKNNVDEAPKWIIQYWQGVPQSGAFSAMSSYGNRFIGLDLFSDAPGKAKWNTDYFKGRPYIFCMLHNFGGRSGLHGRLESTMNDYFRALAKGNNMQGIGATPEGTETNPILYDMLFELPWMNPATRPTADEWLEEYAYSRYGIKNDNALAALQNLKKSVWACPTDQQGTSEAVILARPNWTVGSVSSWSTSAIYWDTQDVLLAADQLSSIEELVTTADGVANYNYDFIDVIRQAMVDYAAQLLPLINASRNNNAEYTRLYKLYLQLMLDLDDMLSYDENFKLERWTSLARNIANEVTGTTDNDRNWLEWNARTQITVWSKGDTDLHDYSNRCWAGLIKDYHYKRWEKFFTTNGGSFNGGWHSGFEYPWTVDFTNYNYSTVTIPSDMTATAKAKQTFGKYFGRIVGKDKNFLFPMGITTNGTKSDVIPEVYRGKTVALPLKIGKDVTVTNVWIDLNNDGAASSNEALEISNNKVTIPADAAIGKTTAKATYNDGTVIMFNIALIEDITDARTVKATAGANGSVAIEGADGTTVTNTLAVKMIATPNTGYNFEKWTDAQGNTISNDNPFIYYGKEDATFTANFIQDKWGVVACNGSFSGDIAGYSQFIHNLTLAYYNREPETIFEATTAPTEIFNTVPTIVNIPQGASFDVAYDNGGSDGLKYCYFRAFIDLNSDGDFDDEGELLKEAGTNGAANPAVCSNKINILLPYDMPLGITHMRLRFDGAWDNSSKPSDRGAKEASIRPVYEIIINVTEFSDKAAHITVASNNEEWGTAKVWTDETPDGSTRTEWDVTKGVPFYMAAEKTSEDVEFMGWYDQYGRLVSKELNVEMFAREDATYTARFRKIIEIDGWQFEYRTDKSETNRIVLTKIRKNGNHDLVIPATVDILGNTYTNVGFDNNLFNDNKDLWTISLPSTIEQLSDNKVFSTSVEGKGANASANSANYITTDFGTTLTANEDWSISLTVEDNGNNFNQWGSALIATGNAPMNSTYATGFQLYMQAGGGLVVKTDVNGDGNKLTNLAKGTKYRIDVVYTHSNKKLIVTSTPLEATSPAARAASASLEITQDMSDFSIVSHAIPEGVNITVLEVRKGTEPDPFEGCTNLFEIEIANGCKNYYINTESGALYTTGGTKLHEVADKEKANEIRTLGELVDLTKALIAEVATTVNPTGKATEVALNTTQGNDYYIWCNNPHVGGNDGAGGVAALLDEDANSYLHSNWSSLSTTHDYLQIDFGNAVGLNNFKIAGQQRKDGQNDRPKNIDIYGSNDNSTWTHITTVEGLPNTTGATWESGTISVKTRYSHLKFIVKTHDNYNQTSPVNRPYFHMAKFDLFKVTSTAEVATKYANLVSITAAEIENAYDNLTEALYYYNNSGTAKQLQAAHDALKPSYDALNAKKEKILNGVYNINYKNNPIFVAYSPQLGNLTGATAGFRLFDATTDNTTDDSHIQVQNNAIGAKSAADALFTIVPNNNATGYSISTQGMFLGSTQTGGWSVLSFTDANNAGVYLFEEVEESIFKLKSNKSDIQYVNDWGPIFGNDKSNKPNLSTYTLTQITEYTLTVPTNDATTLCLPFNVVLPAGVTAYDIAKSNITNSTYELVTVATTGETLAKNTPVIIKATAGDYTLTITMEEENVKTSVKNSVLRSGLVKTTVAAGNNYTFNGEDFNIVATDSEIAANQCWMELDENCGDKITRFDSTTTDIKELKDINADAQVFYDLQGRKLNAITKPGLYIVNGKKVLVK
ncbi:MAG: alpha-N-acetylglucosaminidase C-terminal domain-containing protein [Bacteroidaceae bacterium]|nr:alpha-N-acetylglucosaminidase C-terminal domain-containing protein [Bacteroidaceae bacterium]